MPPTNPLRLPPQEGAMPPTNALGCPRSEGAMPPTTRSRPEPTDSVARHHSEGLLGDIALQPFELGRRKLIRKLLRSPTSEGAPAV